MPKALRLPELSNKFYEAVDEHLIKPLEQADIDPEEMGKVEKARESFIDFVKYTFPTYKAEKFHEHVAANLDRVVSGEVKRLMLFAPPQHGKPLDVDTLVTIAGGWKKRLGDVSVGELVVTQSNDMHFVTAVHEQGVLPILEIKTRSGRAIRSAHDHHFFTPSGFVAASTLRAGMMLLTRFVDDEIISIEESGVSECRCLTVEGDPTFIANDFVVHNSELVSTRFPSYWLAKVPDMPIALISYGATLAERNSRNARSVYESYLYQTVYPHMMKDLKNWRMADWHVKNHRGYVLSAGVGGPITGHGFGLAVIDDPIENWAAAQSDALRESAWQWYLGTFKTRMWENGSVVLMMCMPYYTRVMMENGSWRELGTIKVGERVATWKDGKLVSRKVEAFLPQGKAQIYEVKTGNQTIRATGNHPFLVYQDDKYYWKRADALEKDDRLVILGQTDYEDNPDNLESEDLWALGFMWGDGWMIKTKPSEYGSKRYALAFARGMNEETNNRILAFFKNKFGVDVHYYEKARYYRNDRHPVGKWFEAREFKGKSKTKRIPEYVFSLPIELRRSFLLGFIAADGHYNPKVNRIEIRIANEPLLKDIKLLAQGCGYRVSNIYKYEAMFQAPGSPVPILAANYHISFSLTNTEEDAFALKPVRSVTLGDVEEVYDLTVKDTHNFIAEGVVVHNTRWNEDDLAGRIIDREGTVEEGGEWTVLAYPALAEEENAEKKIPPDPLGRAPGEALAPSRYSAKYLRTMQDSDPYVFAAEYQQRPTRPTGQLFKIGRVNFVDTLPPEVGILDLENGGLKAIGNGSKRVRFVRYWDFAATEADMFSPNPAYTVGTLLALFDTQVKDLTGQSIQRVYILDVVRARFEPEGVGAKVKETAYLDGKHVEIFIEREPGSAGKAVIASYRQMLIGHKVEEDSPSGDKVVRAHPVASQFNAGNILVVKALWNREWLSELASFPAGRFKDQVDSLSGGYKVLTEKVSKWKRSKFKAATSDGTVNN